MRFVMNDYELIYLIRSERDVMAMEYLLMKYQKLIWKHIHRIGLPDKDHDDYFQEGLMMLVKATKTFDERHNKTFTRYFELIMTRHFYHLKRASWNVVLHDHVDFVTGTQLIEESLPSFDFQSDLEETVYQDYFINRRSVKDLSLELGVDKKKIYNTIYRVREKLKSMLGE
ncbi:MAG: sigma-70 family RNA polymerase sigma factor [Acholeplasmataceae bacterium]|nr:sigma-70 family RNA polymerase sigma factor [Acholeplasmataceae bacterium]